MSIVRERERERERKTNLRTRARAVAFFTQRIHSCHIFCFLATSRYFPNAKAFGGAHGDCTELLTEMDDCPTDMTARTQLLSLANAKYINQLQVFNLTNQVLVVFYLNCDVVQYVRT